MARSQFYVQVLGQHCPLHRRSRVIRGAPSRAVGKWRHQRTLNQFDPVAQATQYGAMRIGNCSAATTHPASDLVSARRTRSQSELIVPRGPQEEANPKMKTQLKVMRILPATSPSGSGRCGKSAWHRGRPAWRQTYRQCRGLPRQPGRRT